MRRARVNWIAREAELRAMVADGKLLRDMAAYFGCSRVSAQKAMHRIGLRIDPVAVDRARRETCATINASPDRRQRVSDGMKRRYARDPAYREKIRVATTKRWQREGFRDDVMPKIRAFAVSDEGLQMRAKGGRIAAKNKLAWCPPHMIDDYRAHLNKMGCAAEARRIIMDEWALQLRRALRQIAAVAKPIAEEQSRLHSSFEAQLARVASGKARVVPTFRPSRHVSDERSLIGNSGAMAAGL